MKKPRILVLTAAGKTGLPTALQLLGEGFPVTAFVRREDGRSRRLSAAGADIVAGSLTDAGDMKRAMEGADRAYFCTPLAEGNLKAASLFAEAAAARKLESVVAMSQWLASPDHPSLHTRETWFADGLLSRLPGTGLTILNPGFFADNEMQVLPFAAQFGLLMLPYGSGLNAPPSNEDMARVAAEILARPAGHAGKTYRPTGPRLLSPQDIAATFASVLGRKVRYVNAPIGVLSRVMKGMGFSDYFIAQYQQYALDYQRGAFAVSAPTDVVRAITGREAEDYEQIARRYAAAMPGARRSIATQLRLIAMMTAWMAAPGPRTARHLSRGDASDPKRVTLSADSSEWRSGHEAQAKTAGA